MKIALATDHAGFEKLKEIEYYLESLGHECRNFGPVKFNPKDDYPDFIIPAAQTVAAGGYERGIIMGGSGEGEAIAANRVQGVRCALYYGPSVAKTAVDAEGHVNHDPLEIIRLSRQHNDSNMLSLAARFLSLDEMKQAVKLWLETPFGGEENHKRRISKLDKAKK